MALITLLLIPIIISSLLAFYNCYWKRRKLPPGPMPLPFIGNMHTFQKRDAGEDIFIEWSKQYGPLFTFWVGEQPVVMATDYDQIIESFQKDGDAYAGRVNASELVKMLKGGACGIIQSEGDLWRDQRRFVLHVFRDFGVGKNVMQEKILTEIGSRFEKLDAESQEHGDVNLTSTFDIGVGSIINDLLFGYRFVGEHTEKFRELKELVRNFMRQISRFSAQPANQYPNFFKKVPFFRNAVRDLETTMKTLFGFYGREIERHRKDINFEDLGAPSTDYVEAFLKERERREQNGETGHNYTLHQLSCVCFDLWLAGQETTSTTLGWGVAYILKHPEVQKKLHDELDAVIGSADSYVTVASKPDLPYTNAVINEIQRCANIVRINVLHRTTRDVTVNGYFLPKGTCIIPQIAAVLSNEQYFEKPKTFNPDRFITPDGKLAKCDQLIPFSVGKRQCLGEPLARMELFLFLANFFNWYTMRPADELPSLERSIKNAFACPPYRVILERRVIP